ncbi:MAG TPA: hypothetical protein VI248_14530 [Kineosporiaceae bacterium]
MSELDDVRAELAELRVEVADIRVFASMADRDAAGVRGIVRAQNALHETQVGQAQTLRGMADALAALVLGQQRHERTLQAQGATLVVHGEILSRLVDGQAALSEKVTRHDEVLAEILRRVSGND